MAKVIIGTYNISGIFRKDEDVDLAEYAFEDGKYKAKAGGKIVGHLRYLPDFSDPDSDYWELEIPAWDYPEQNFMLTIKQKK
jgi:hypothetical protein